jgi:limonene-1,2-epoxide hydrolase
MLLVPLSLPSTLNRPALAQSEDDWAEEEEDWGDEGSETEALPTVSDPDEFYQFDDNPLNPLGSSLDLLIQTQINGDLWAAMLGDLPCLEPTQACIGELQTMAVENNLTLQIINERVAAIEERIDEARSRNQTAVLLDSFEPLLARYLTYETVIVNGERQQRGFFDNLLEAIANPINAINEALSLVGIPLIRGITQTNARAQQTAISISDLQVKVAAIEADARQIDQALREEVTLRVIDFDATRREFQISQEIARRATVQHQLLEVDYRFGNLNSQAYLSSLNSLDQQKAQTYRAWARMRAQLSQLKMLVLGVQGN